MTNGGSNPIVESFSASQKRAKAAEKAPSKLPTPLDEKEIELSVEGWEFVSGHAIAQEYVESAPSVVSMV